MPAIEFEPVHEVVDNAVRGKISISLGPEHWRKGRADGGEIGMKR